MQVLSKGTYLAALVGAMTLNGGSTNGPFSIGDQAREAHARELLGRRYHGIDARMTKSESALQSFVLEEVRARLPRHAKAHAKAISTSIIEESARYRLDPIFIMAVAMHESRFNPDAVGTQGELGLMQIREQTAKWISSKMNLEWKGKASLRDCATNIRIGTAYMAYLRRKLHSSGRLYISAYNMGVANLKRVLEQQLTPTIYFSHVMALYTRFYASLESQSRSIASM